MYVELAVMGYVDDANGPLDKGECVDSVASLLAEYVYEHLAGEGFLHGYAHRDQLYRKVQQMIATRMISQYEYDTTFFNGVMSDIVSDPNLVTLIPPLGI